jgi:endonuclease/exonuclease/phosphatase family metal-dependent hydrolase
VWKRAVIGRGADVRKRSALLLVAALGGVLAFAWSDGTRAAHPAPAASGATFTVMQMNMCLSGLAGCYIKVDYPAVVQEAVTRISATHPNAVTLNEACRSDVAHIARRTGYHVRFSRVLYRGKRLRCSRPGDRGLFGDAVLTKATIETTDEHAFDTQGGIERRRWLCVTTRLHVDVCTAHLNTRSPGEVAGNDAQCRELATLLARRATRRTVVFAGDVNRGDSCAPKGVWTRTDSAAEQAPGLQHVYGSGALRSPSAHVVPATHTDHDVLLVSAQVHRHG